MKSKLSTIFIILVFFLGLSLLLYPSVSQAWNERHQTGAIVDYDDQVGALDEETAAQLRAEAEAWNAALLARGNTFFLPDDLTEEYAALLTVSDGGVMAYLEIPSIGVSLPILHGTGDGVLSKAVGHLEWSSLPVGGAGTHCVLSGHRGLPSSELLTNIDHLEVGDRFYLHVLGDTLEYQVDHIAVVEPDDLSLLSVTEGEDCVTLVTCTPYGINSHRLLVRGTRVARSEGVQSGAADVKNEVSAVDTGLLVGGSAAVFLTAAFLLLLIGGRKPKKKGVETLHDETDETTS